MTDSDGKIILTEMAYGDSVIMIASEYEDWARTPTSVGGKNTQRIHVRIPREIDEHCARARKAGARIVIDLFDQPWGERIYAAAYLADHYWRFSQPPAHRPSVMEPFETHRP